MGNNKNFVKLGSLCSQVLTGGTPLTQNKHFYEGGTIPWLKTKEVNFNFIHKTENHITKAGLDCSSAKLVPVNSIIVAMYGQGDTAGRVAINKIPLTTNQACCNLVIDPGKADYRFIYYYLKSSYSELVRRKTGSAQPNLNTKILREFEVIDIPLEQQINIGNQLETLDNKIHLNRQINKTLEQMAQALFKSWFVDFDPVVDNALDAGFFEQELDLPDELLRRAEARKAVRAQAGFKPLPTATRQLFPAAFEPCAEPSLGLGGWVPKGWAVGELQDLLVLQRGFDLPASTRTPGAYPLIAASGPNGTHNIAMAKGPGVVTGRSGVLGKVFFTLEDYWPLNTTLWVKEFKQATPCYAYELLRMLDFSSFNAGSAVPTLNRNHIHSLKYLLPSQALVQEFETKAMLMHRRILVNTKQTDTLAALRDTLLPKLISGELSLDKFELTTQQGAA